MKRLILAGTALAFLAVPALAADAPKAPDLTARIIDAGMNHGEIMLTAQYLTDRIGGRIPNSPAMRAAERWTQGRFRDWGLGNVHAEPFLFGRGWSIEAINVRMTTPRVLTLRAIPIAFTPGTAGPVTADIIVAPISKEADFARWKGKLASKIVLVTRPTEGSEPAKPAFQRLSDEEIRKLDRFDQPITDSNAADRRTRRSAYDMKLDAFLKAEGALVYVKQSYRDGGLLHGEGYGYRLEDQRQVPGIELAAEDYRRLARLARTNVPGAADRVTLEIDSRVTFHTDDPNANNIIADIADIADIAGSDPKAGYVMAGAHLDSWVAGDGAADNGAGSVVVMEAARILASLGVKPRRTIRFALWNAEEQGLLGRLAYIDQHLAARPKETDPEKLKAGDWSGWARRYPVTPKGDYGALAAYFNLDNGSGKIRGIHAEGNAGVAPIFREWLALFASMGATAVVNSRTGGTDHVFMQSVGLPGYQFIQDPLDYDSRVHHTSIDTFDHMKAADLRQAAVIMASFLWNAANRPEPLPRLVPSKPAEINPFAYPEPED